MSQADPSTEIQALLDDFALNSVNFAALALLIYDTLLMLPSEIKLIWCKTVKLGTVLYLLARYLPDLGFFSCCHIWQFLYSLP
ncbi:hypothetical protein JB92DRAFT_3019239 [Gautieria morchelliformis]|nr:hypothetical protein JB92DRAFT_3019239 [Gautieria morchelliformis]